MNANTTRPISPPKTETGTFHLDPSNPSSPLSLTRRVDQLAQSHFATTEQPGEISPLEQALNVQTGTRLQNLNISPPRTKNYLQPEDGSPQLNLNHPQNSQAKSSPVVSLLEDEENEENEEEDVVFIPVFVPPSSPLNPRKSPFPLLGGMERMFEVPKK